MPTGPAGVVAIEELAPECKALRGPPKDLASRPLIRPLPRPPALAGCDHDVSQSTPFSKSGRISPGKLCQQVQLGWSQSKSWVCLVRGSGGHPKTWHLDHSFVPSPDLQLWQAAITMSHNRPLSLNLEEYRPGNYANRSSWGGRNRKVGSAL